MIRQRTYGYDSCENSVIDVFYRSISEDLEAFAAARHLTIWKYPDRVPMWMFHFLHPAGGFGWLQLYCATELKRGEVLRLSVSGTWYVDDHEKRLRRHYPHAESFDVQPISKDIVMCLARQLEALLRCPATDLVPSEYSYVPTGDGAGNDRVSDFELSLRVAV
jgi:hypothetical protein